MAAEYRDERVKPRSERRTILIGPADEFSADHRDAFVHAVAVAEAEMQIRRVLAARGIVVSRSSQS